jgi:hypothetical protein
MTQFLCGQDIQAPCCMPLDVNIGTSLSCQQLDYMPSSGLENRMSVRFEVFTAMTMKNGVFWDVTPFVTRATRRNIPEDTIPQ